MSPLDWQPISTAPKDGREILIRQTGDGVCRGSWGNASNDWLISASDNDWAWTPSGQIQHAQQPSHWAPLPKGPLP